MKSLFVRIFLSFWLAMGLILIGSVGVTAAFIINRSTEIQSLVPGELAITAEQRLVSGGLDGVRDWARDMRNMHPGLDIFIVDALGRSITKQTPPEFIQRRIARLQSEGLLNGPSRRGSSPGGDLLRTEPQITAANGAVYTLVFSQVPDWSPAVLGTPGIQALLLMLALTISGSICWYLARSVTRPVEKLQSSARSLANGNLDARVGAEFAYRKDELAVLAHDFDQMADRLRSLIDSKEELLRDVSHELRTPLARLRLALGLARREGADLGREHDRIEREAERLDELIGEILRLSRLSSAQQAVHRERFDFAALVASVAEDARLEAHAQNKEVSFNYVNPLTLLGDQELFRSAIENVVRNALRFTAVNTAVEITLTPEINKVVLEIRDHGPGVPEAELDRLFEPFYRVTQQARERDTGGYGLGLAITSRVISVHQGTVMARNAVDGGLIITMTVPV